MSAGFWLEGGSDGDGGKRPDAWIPDTSDSSSKGGACLLVLLTGLGVSALGLAGLADLLWRWVS